MFFLLLSILTSALIAVVMRLSSHKIQNPLSMLLSNYLVFTALGMIYTDFQYPNEDGVGVKTVLTRTITVDTDGERE